MRRHMQKLCVICCLPRCSHMNLERGSMAVMHTQCLSTAAHTSRSDRHARDHTGPSAADSCCHSDAWVSNASSWYSQWATRSLSPRLWCAITITRASSAHVLTTDACSCWAARTCCQAPALLTPLLDRCCSLCSRKCCCCLLLALLLLLPMTVDVADRTLLLASPGAHTGACCSSCCSPGYLCMAEAVSTSAPFCVGSSNHQLAAPAPGSTSCWLLLLLLSCCTCAATSQVFGAGGAATLLAAWRAATSGGRSCRCGKPDTGPAGSSNNQRVCVLGWCLDSFR